VIPVEVKAEHSDVSREHVHKSYLSQADDYATARDRIAFLMVLDLRPVNSGRHVKRRQMRGVSQTPPAGLTPIKMYNLAESFWIDGLPVDPQIEGAKENVVVVGLAPGNRARPSSTTSYSRKPRQ
jgi:hypothetical protein